MAQVKRAVESNVSSPTNFKKSRTTNFTFKLTPDLLTERIEPAQAAPSFGFGSETTSWTFTPSTLPVWKSNNITIYNDQSIQKHTLPTVEDSVEIVSSKTVKLEVTSPTKKTQPQLIVTPPKVDKVAAPSARTSFPVDPKKSNCKWYSNPKDFWKSIGQFKMTEDVKPAADIKQEANRYCSMCLKVLPENDDGIVYQGKILHDTCLVCTACYLPLAFASVYLNENRPYCKRDNPAAPEVVRDPSVKLEITAQPEKYQIANYNVYPAPQITFAIAITKTTSLIASLIENLTQTEIPLGFTSGNVFELLPGSQSKTFSSLKICKKSHVKSYLKDHNLKPKEVTFCIRFAVGDVYWHTKSFKLLSACSQLPSSERDVVRPFTANKLDNHSEFVLSSPVSPSSSPSSSLPGTPMQTAVTSPSRDMKMSFDFIAPH